jgi:hypothetical protein
VKVTFARVVRSEWTKLVSLRSTWVTLITTVLLIVGLAGVVGRGVRNAPEPVTVSQAVGVAFLPVDFAMLIVGVFGVLQMTGEYGSGLVRATLTAVPRRWPVVAAKAVAQAALMMPLMLATCLAAFLVCQAFLDGASLGDAGVLRAVFGAAGSLVLVGLLGLGIGALLRHTAAAITVLVAAMFIVPALLGPALPGNREEAVMRFVPTVAAQAMYSVGGGNPFKTFSPDVSAVVLAGWAALLLAGGVLVLRRRDA